MDAPTTEEIRNKATGEAKEASLLSIMEKFLELQFKAFPAICEETRLINIQMLKELNEVGHKTPARYVGGKVYEGSTGWSKDKSFKYRWVISKQLRLFMTHIYREFWDDGNAKVRDKFMKEILMGGDCYAALHKVYVIYGKDNSTIITPEDVRAVSV